MRFRRKIARRGPGGAVALRCFASILAVAASLSCAAATATPQPDQIFETNVTRDLTISSGEPQIAVDPQDPRNIAIIEFAAGTKAIPAYSVNPFAQPGWDQIMAVPEGWSEAEVDISRDGGDHWTRQGRPGPLSRPPLSTSNPPMNGGGDPYIAYGPDGTLYPGTEVGVHNGKRPLFGWDFPHQPVALTYSLDQGKTYAPPQVAGSPIDRPWLKVDETTGMVYTVSSGQYNAKTGEHNVPGPDAPADRWLVAWQPHLAGKSEPRRIGGPDFSGATESWLAAAQGTVASTFVIGSRFVFPGAPPAPSEVPVPASLQSIVPAGVTSCSQSHRCVFFETSADDGQHWTRHFIAADGLGAVVDLAADPGRRGRFALAFNAGTKLQVLVTDDSGVSWKGAFAIPETGSGADFKQAMAYGPTGVLGFVWKKQRDDLTPPQPAGGGIAAHFSAAQPAFDVYAAISCDGGVTWNPPLQVNKVTSPAGPGGYDDLSYIALDAHYAHMVWGDRRNLPKVKNVPGGIGGVQAYYGRVPFSLAAHGAACGR